MFVEFFFLFLNPFFFNFIYLFLILSLDSIKLNEVSSLLTSNSHFLPQAILQTLLALNPPPANLDTLISYFLYLHQEPENLFKLLLEDEIKRVKSISVVMRERSLSVCLLRFLLDPFRPKAESLLDPLLKLGRDLKKKKLETLMKPLSVGQGKNLTKLQQRFVSNIAQLLNVQLFPQGLCVLSYCVWEMVRASKYTKRTDKTPLSYWAVGSVIFLRLLVPQITSHSLLFEGEKRKGLTLVGKLLMKLACRSRFSNPTGGERRESGGGLLRSSDSGANGSFLSNWSLRSSDTGTGSRRNSGGPVVSGQNSKVEKRTQLDGILDEALPLFETFCEDVVEYGRGFFSSGSGVWGGERGDGEFLSEYELLKIRFEEGSWNKELEKFLDEQKMAILVHLATGDVATTIQHRVEYQQFQGLLAT